MLYGGFNSVSVSSDCWALSLEWENQGCGGDDPAEFELRGGDFTSLVNEGNGRTMYNSASTPTLAHDPSAASFASSNASTTIRFASDTKNPPLSHSASAADILASLGVDTESIEKALTNFKREKIIASKEAAAERQERIRLEDIISELTDEVAKLKAEREKLKAEMGEEGAALKKKIREHQVKISALKIQIKEQQDLMLRMDVSRVQEVGILRHAKGAQAEMMVDFGQPTVVEHELVRIKHDAEISCQVDPRDLGGGEGDITRKDLAVAEEEAKERARKSDLDSWVRSKRVADEDDVELVDGMEDRELAPNDGVIRDSPRKINTSRSTARGQLSVRIMEPGEEVGLGMGATEVLGVGESEGAGNKEEAATGAATGAEAAAGAEAAMAVKKGSDLGPPNPTSRPSSSEDTARVTVVPKYGGGGGGGGNWKGSAPDTSRVDGMVEEDGLLEGAVIDSNPFSDAFTNIPEMAVSVPPENILDTTRTGISEISDGMTKTGWDFGVVREWKSTRIRVAAAEIVQAFVRGTVCAPLRVEERRAEVREEERRRREEEAKVEDEVDLEFNELVDENERLGEANISMTYEIDRMRRELEEMKRTVKEREAEEEDHGGKGKAKGKTKGGKGKHH